MPVSSSLAARLQRFAFLRVLGQGLQGARLPVDPGGVLLLGRRHRVDRLHHLLPARLAAVGAQGGAHLPGEQVVGQLELLALAVGALGAQELVGRLGLQLDRGLPREAGPGPGREVGRQRLLPAVDQHAGDRLAVGRGEAGEGQGGELGIDAAPTSPPSSPGSGPGRRRSRRRWSPPAQPSRTAAWRAARALFASAERRIFFQMSALVELLGVDEDGGEQGAAVVVVLLRHPGGDARGLDVAAGDLLGDQRVAGDLAVVVHAKARELGAEVGPVAAPAELEQPVVAQPVLDIAAAPALGERGQLGLLRLAQAVAQLPVLDPEGERIGLGDGLGAQRGQAVAIALAQRLARVEHRGGRDRRRRRRGARGSRQRGEEGGAERDEASDASTGRPPVRPYTDLPRPAVFVTRILCALVSVTEASSLADAHLDPARAAPCASGCSPSAMPFSLRRPPPPRPRRWPRP